MAIMKKRRKRLASKRKPTQEQIDQLVTIQADEDSAWEKPTVVRRPKSMPLSISGDLAALAAFLAKIHRESGLVKWFELIVRVRVEIDVSEFTDVKMGIG